ELAGPISMKLFDMATFLYPAEMRGPPLGVLDDGLRAAKANAQWQDGHGVFSRTSIHTVLHGAPKLVDGLVWVANRNEPTTTELGEQRKICGAEVLVFIDHGNRKSRE